MNDYLIELDKEVSSAASSIPSSLSPTDHDYSNNNTTNIANSNNTLLPNFAQAALLLQNSSGVYSRKVEYLHTLVYEAFHKLIEQVNQNSKSSYPVDTQWLILKLPKLSAPSTAFSLHHKSFEKKCYT